MDTDVHQDEPDPLEDSEQQKNAVGRDDAVHGVTPLLDGIDQSGEQIEASPKLLIDLPPVLFRQVMQFLFFGVWRTSHVTFRRSALAPIKYHRTMDIVAILRSFASVSKDMHSLIHQMPELYLSLPYKPYYWKKRSKKSFQLAIGGRPLLNHSRFSRPFLYLSSAPSNPIASMLQQVDLRGTAITSRSVVMVLQTCPSLAQLDLGECRQLDVSLLASRLKNVPLQTLLVKHLKFMEVCGSGAGDLWIGYRPQLACADEHDIQGCSANFIKNRSYQRAKYFKSQYDTKPYEADVYYLFTLSRQIKPLVLQIENMIHQAQDLIGQKTPTFTMAVNACEECSVEFAEWMYHDGKRYDDFDSKQKILAHLRSYGKHTCQQCGKSAFLCMDCASFRYHYCFQPECKVCYCVECDGGRSPKASYTLDDVVTWGLLKEQGTSHFRLMDCRYEEEEDPQWTCNSTKYWMMICKDETACVSASQYSPCKNCNTWACESCNWHRFTTCPLCDEDVCGFCDDLINCDCEPMCRKCAIVENCVMCVACSTEEHEVFHCNDCRHRRHPVDSSDANDATADGEDEQPMNAN